MAKYLFILLNILNIRSQHKKHSDYDLLNYNDFSIEYVYLRRLLFGSAKLNENYNIYINFMYKFNM